MERNFAGISEKVPILFTGSGTKISYSKNRKDLWPSKERGDDLDEAV